MSSDSTPRERFPRRVRRLSLVLGATAVAVAVFVAVLVVRLDDPAPSTPASAAPAHTTVPPAAGDPGPADGPPGASPGSEAVEAPPVPALTDADDGARAVEAALADTAATATIRYAFDAGPGRTVLDTGGRYALRPVVARGGTVGFVRRGDGYAIRFPARCRATPANCPRAILESTRADPFNAGTRPVRYGAAIQMTRADTAAGANVLQKGFSTGGGTQFKLQVDGQAGRPSCVLATGGRIYRLVGRAGIADGRWHSVTCTRLGGRLTINVDGRAASRQVPTALSIRNDQPLRIGGKNAGPNNDQFAGRLDNVFVTIY